MISLIKKFLGTSKSDNVEVDVEIESAISSFYSDAPSHEVLNTLGDIREPIIYGNVNSKQSIMLMDDQDAAFYLYNSDFVEIERRFDFSVLDEFKIVRCDGPEAGFIASNYINTVKDEIVIAILDLTLGKIVKMPTGRSVLYDGIDVALELIEHQPHCKIGFCTAHMLDETNPAIRELINKFSTTTGHNLIDYSFSKNGDRAAHIHGLIEAVRHREYTKYDIGDDDARSS